MCDVFKKCVFVCHLENRTKINRQYWQPSRDQAKNPKKQQEDFYSKMNFTVSSPTVFLEEGISFYLEDYASFHALLSYTYQKTQGMWTVIFSDFNLLKDEKKKKSLNIKQLQQQTVS